MMKLLMICCALALAGCGDEEPCRAGCEKAAECDGEGEVSIDECVQKCSTDEENVELVRCYAAVSGCARAAFDICIETAATACHRAIDKINTCTAAAGETDMVAFAGWCNDEAMAPGGPSGTRTIPLKSWSKEYLACDVDPMTCHCPGQTWLYDL